MDNSSTRSEHDNNAQTPEIPDYASKPYAQFLEEALLDMVKHDPVSIAFVCILPDGSIGTTYYNCDCTDIVLMENAMSKDEHLLWMKVNADLIAETLEGLDEEDDYQPDEMPDDDAISGR